MGGIAAGTMLGVPHGTGEPFGPLVPSAHSLSPEPGGAGPGTYLEIDGVTGGSSAAGHSGDIDVESWSIAMNRSDQDRNGRPAGRPTSDPLVVAKRLDRATPQLMESLTTGKTHEAAVLTVASGTGSEATIFFELALAGVTVAALADAGTGGTDAPGELVSLNYGSIRMRYTVLNKDGSAGETVTSTWDLQRNRA